MTGGRRAIRAVAKIVPGLANACFPQPDCAEPGREIRLAKAVLDSVGVDVVWTGLGANRSKADGYQRLFDGRVDFVADTDSLRNLYLPDVVAQLFGNFSGVSRTAAVSTEWIEFLVGRQHRRLAFFSVLFPSWAVAEVWLHLAALFGLCWAGRRLWQARVGGEAVDVARGAVVGAGLLVAILLGLYGNVMAVRLALPQPVLPVFASVDEYAALVESGRCRLASDTDESVAVFGDVFLRPPDGVYDAPWYPSAVPAQLRRAFRRHPPLPWPTGEEGLEMLAESESCVLLLRWASTIFDGRRDCRFDALSFPQQRITTYFFFRTDAIDRTAAATLADPAAMAHAAQRVSADILRSQPSLDCSEEKILSLALEQFGDPLRLFVALAALATAVFVWERRRRPLLRHLHQEHNMK